MSTQKVSTKHVVVISRSDDITGLHGELGHELESRGVRVLRFCTDQFPTNAQVVFAQDGDREVLRFCADGQQVELGPDDAIWYRRANWGAKLPQDMDAQLRRGCMLESEACLRGVRFAIKSLFVLLMIVIPVPLLPVAPKMGKTDKRNVPGQVKPKE